MAFHVPSGPPSAQSTGGADALREENAELRVRLHEIEETLAAIRRGDVDALVVGSDIYTLDSSHAAANKLRQDVLAQMEDAVLAFDLDDHLVFMNAAAERHYGHTASSTLGCAKAVLFEELWPDGAAQRAAAQALRRHGVFRGTLVHRLPQGGSQAHVETTVSLLRDGQGQPSGQLHVIRDISERVRSEQALAQAAAEVARRERQFSTLVENSPDIFARLDRSLRHLYVSPIVSRYTGADPAAFLGRTNAELGMPPELCDEWRVAMEAVFASGQVGRKKFSFVGPDGSEHVFDARLVPEFDGQGAVESVLSVAVNVTDQEQINAALRESQVRLQEADARKDEFLATLAHELRNPLAPIRNALHIMRLTPDPVAHLNARGVVERQLAQMVRLVDDLLDISRVSRGKMELRPEVADLAHIVQSAVETSRPLIDADRHQLAVHVPPAGALMVDGDVTRLCQVVANVLNNAAKYTPAGGRIAVEARRQDGHAVVTVQDTGIGIAQDMLPRVFDMFTQVDRSAGRSQGGLGIGLALVARLVDMHGGYVQAHSDGAGRGSRFTIGLPLAAHAASHSRVDAIGGQAAGASGVRVLIVDDNIDSAQTLADVLQRLGYQTATAHDGPQALRRAGEFVPDIAVLDIGLPHLSGHEVARQIRAAAWGRDMLLIALSGWGQEGDQRKSMEAGFDHHFVKPVDIPVLLRVLATSRRSGTGP